MNGNIFNLGFKAFVLNATSKYLLSFWTVSPFFWVRRGREVRVVDSTEIMCFRRDSWRIRLLSGPFLQSLRRISFLFTGFAFFKSRIEPLGMLRSDRINIRKSTQAELQAAAARGDSAAVHRAVRRMVAGIPGPPLKLMSADEKQLLDPIQIASRLHEHVACLHGHARGVNEKQAHDSAEALQQVPVDLRDIPSNGREITATFAHFSPWETWLEDNSPPALFRFAANT